MPPLPRPGTGWTLTLTFPCWFRSSTDSARAHRPGTLIAAALQPFLVTTHETTRPTTPHRLARTEMGATCGLSFGLYRLSY